MAQTKQQKEREAREARDAQRQENIEQTVSATEQFYNENKKTIWGVLCGVLVLALAIFGWHKFIYEPRCVEAMQQAFPAEISFQNGEFELALNGDGNHLGFADLIDEYGTKSGKAVYLYAGVCELQLGNYEQAISYLKKYKGKEPILAARAKACEGDAYVGLGDYAAAVRSYKAAVDHADNIFAAGYLVKEGTAYEALGQKAEALACYKAVIEDYPQSLEAYDVTKYIARVSE